VQSQIGEFYLTIAWMLFALLVKIKRMLLRTINIMNIIFCVKEYLNQAIDQLNIDNSVY
jgi:hypothetical protein